MIRARIVKVFLPAFVLLLLAGVFQWLLHTTPGARFLLQRMTASLPGDFAFESISGDLGSGLDVQRFSFDGSALSIAAANIHAQIVFDLLPPSVAIESLLVDQVRIHHRGENAGDKSPAEILAGLASPLPLHFVLVEMGRLSFQDSSAQSAFEATDLRVSARWHDQFELTELAFQAGGVQSQAAGELEFAPPFALNATISNWLKPTADGRIPEPGMRLETSIAGNLDDLAVQATLDRPELAVDGHLMAVLTTPNWDAHLQSDVLQWPFTDAYDLHVAWQQFTADITGTASRYKLSAQGVLDLKGASGPGVSGDLDLQGSGDLDGLQLERLSLSGDLVKLVATGPVSWSDGLRIELANEVERFSPGRWIPDWPEDYPIHGTLDARWQQGQLTVPEFNLQAGESDFHITGSGDFDSAQKASKADLGWQSLQWPLAAAQPIVRSDSGQLKVSGHPEDWTVSGSIQVQAGGWPQGDLIVSGHGDLESVQLQIQQGEVLGGQFTGQASYSWIDQRPWSAELTASNLDVTAAANGYPLVISGNVIASGQAKANTLALNIQQLSGRAHGQPLEASGEIALEAGVLRARDLLIHSGSSHLALNGNVQDPEGMRFSGQLDSLASFLDHAAGSIAGEGRISLDPLSPVLELKLQGTGLAWADWRLAALSAGPLDSETEGYADRFALRMDLTGLSVGDRTIDEISLISHGQLPLEQTRITARRKDTRLEAFISGTLQDWQALASARWSGTLESMRLNNDEIGYLELEQAARFALEHSAASIEPACFRGSKNGLLCADLNWADMNQKGRDHLVINASLDKATLNLARFILGTDLAFTQTLDGTLHWEKLPGSSPVANVQIRVSEGKIISADESATLATGPGLFGFIIENGKLRAGNMDITFPEAGAIDTDFSAPDISHGVDSSLQGRAQVSFSSLETFLPWMEPLDHAEGVINADIQLAGTMADPRLTGHASLVRGRIEHLATGLVLSDIKLAGAVFEDNHTELNGNFTAGDGAGRITASVTFDQILKPQAEVRISGQDLTLVNVPDMSIKADPDLDLRWYDGALQVNGSVRVPHAQISPRYLPTATADESPDLVIVAGQLPPAEKSVFDRSRLRLHGSVAVELGEDVTLTLERATARFMGTTVFNWNNELIPIGDGSYSVTGKIAAYGQSLEVSQGKISFPRVPANNPRLDIRAERQIYGNVQVKQAGVLIGGTLKSPLLETYTRPATTEERALALLVTGHDFDYAQGVGAVEVGIYIAPKLYVSYGIGLFENDSVISVRYDLGRGFGIKATSSQRQSGGDVTYTFER